MTDKKKIEVLDAALFKLYKFSSSLTEENLDEFERLKDEITSVLTETEKIRFSQIDFYEDKTDFNEIMDDDLPF